RLPTEQIMDVKLFPLMLDGDGKTIVLAHPWPIDLDDILSGIYEGIALRWVVIFFGKLLVITPITFN
ncbi:MAG: hypothetical protein ACE5G5_11670, partial [Candidatus Methylomirabilales bacterium]